MRNVIARKRLHTFLVRNKRIKVVLYNKQTREKYGERVLTSNGSCTIRYKIPHSGKFSRYQRSCFAFHCESDVKKTNNKVEKARIILDTMNKHDRGMVIITEVWAGDRFNRRIA